MDKEADNENKIKRLRVLIGIMILIAILLIGIFFFRFFSNWCKQGDSWNSPINGLEMKKVGFSFIGDTEVCLSRYVVGDGRMYAFSKDGSVIYREDGWKNFTKIK